MNAIKNACVVIVMVAVGYGVWIILNKSPHTLQEADTAGLWAPPAISPGAEVQPSGAFTQIGDPTATPGTPMAPPVPQNLSPAPGAATARIASDAPTTVAFSDSAVTPAAASGEIPPSQPGQPSRSIYDRGPEDTGSPASGGGGAFVAAWQTSDDLLARGQLAEALSQLSTWYSRPELDSESRRQLVDRLDQLAGTVIFSQQHLLEQPYRVQRGDTLGQVAKNYNVPWQLLAYINGVEDPEVLVPGSELKVVRGPFSAEVNLETSELTLKLGQRYAGRFALGVSRDVNVPEGTFEVRDKMEPGDAANPYGQYWMDLGGNLSIHGEVSQPTRFTPRCISVSPRDARDLYAILGPGSQVTIRR